MADGYSGKNTYLLFGVESTFNTAATTINKDIGVVTGVDPNFSNNVISVYEIGQRESSQNLVGNFDGTIGIDGTLNSGAIFELMLGQSSDNQEAATSDYSHIFIDTANAEGFGALTLPNTASSFSLSENFNSTNDIRYTYTGAKVNSIDFTVEQGGNLDFSSEIVFSSVTTATSVGTQVQTTTGKLSGYNATLSTGTAGGEASVGNTRSVSVSINQNIDSGDMKEIGSRFSAGLIEKNFDTTVSFTKTFVNKTEFERFLGSTTPQNAPADTVLILSVNNGITLGSGRVELYLKLTGGQYDSTNHTVSQDGVIEETFEYINGNMTVLKYVDGVSTYF